MARIHTSIYKYFKIKGYDDFIYSPGAIAENEALNHAYEDTAADFSAQVAGYATNYAEYQALMDSVGLDGSGTTNNDFYDDLTGLDTSITSISAEIAMINAGSMLGKPYIQQYENGWGGNVTVTSFEYGGIAPSLLATLQVHHFIERQNFIIIQDLRKSQPREEEMFLFGPL